MSTRTFLRATLAVVTNLTPLGCSEGSDELVPSPPCEPPNRVVSDLCLEPGFADDGCPAGTLGEATGSCRPAGMLTEDCIDGFIHVPFDEQVAGADGMAGTCEPVLPQDRCSPGLMAVPGDTACRPIMDCGNGPWGNIPYDDDTVFVDANFVGASDGSTGAPYGNITDALGAAGPGALVAVAAGTYAENLTISVAPVRIWGVCPSAVEIVGGDPQGTTVFATGPIDGTELVGLAVRGPGIGIGIQGSPLVNLSNMWIHSNGSAGVYASSVIEGELATVTDSLIENNRLGGIVVAGASFHMYGTAVRSTQTTTEGLYGRGLMLVPEDNGTPADVEVLKSLIESNHEAGVLLVGSSLRLASVAIRGTEPDASGFAVGIAVQYDPSTNASSTATFDNVLVEDIRGFGLLVRGSQAYVQGATVRRTLPAEDGLLGRGVELAGDSQTGLATVAEIRRSVVANNHELGLDVGGSEATVESVVVFDTATGSSGGAGWGISILPTPGMGTPSLASVRGSLVDRSHEVGIGVVGSSATIESTVVRATQPDDGGAGWGVSVQTDPVTSAPSSANLFACRVEDSREAGVLVYRSSVALASSQVANTQASLDGQVGDGVMIIGVSNPGDAVVRNVRVAQAARAGLSAFGSHASLHGTSIICADFDLDVEELMGVLGRFDDGGGNVCGCAATEGVCHPVSTGLQPLEPLVPVQ